MVRQLFKQSGVFFIGSIVSKITTTVTWILLARILSPQNYGEFTLYFMILQVTTFFSDFGMNQYYMKKVDIVGRKILFNKILFVRSITLLLSIFIMIFILFFFKIFGPSISLLLILSMIPMSYLSVSEGYYLEQKKAFRVSLKLASIGLIFLLGYFYYYNNLDLLSSLVILLISLTLTLFWFFPWKEINLKIMPLWESFSILKSSSSYAYLNLTSFIYNRGDSFIISYFKGNVALGIYGLAYRFLESLSLFPSSLVQNLFPISAKKVGLAKKQLIKIVMVMTFFAFVFAFALFIFAPYFVKTFFQKDYWQAIPVLKIFSLVIWLFFINAPLATVVQSSKLVRSFLPWGISNTMLNIFLNLLFIPIFGIAAAAWIMVVTELTGLIINILFIKKLYSHSNYHTL